MIIEYVKVRDAVMDPTRGNPSDAGLDVYFCPEQGSPSCTLNPGENSLLNTGLRFGVPHGYMLQVMNRSSVASKKNLIVGAHVVDSGYDGEVFIDMHNIGTEAQIISPGEKIAQVVVIPVIPFRAKESSSGDLYESYPISISDRGEGALGSTDDATRYEMRNPSWDASEEWEVSDEEWDEEESDDEEDWEEDLEDEDDDEEEEDD